MVTEPQATAGGKPADQWYVKTADGSIYGPADFAALMVWASEARIVPGCSISEGGHGWIPAESIPDLKLDWTAMLPGGGTVGPLHLLAICDLLRDGAIPRGATLTHHQTGQQVPVDDALPALVAQGAREDLAAAARAKTSEPDPERAALAARVAELQKAVAAAEGRLAEQQRRAEDAEAGLRALQEQRAADPTGGAVKERGPATEQTETRLRAMQAEHTAAEHAARERLTAAEKARDTAAQESGRLAEALAAEQSRRVQAQKETEERAQRLQNRVAALERVAATASDMRARLAQAEEEQGRATAALAALQEQFDAARAQHAAESRDWQAQRTAFVTDVAALRHDLETAQASLEGKKQAFDRLAAEHHQALDAAAQREQELAQRIAERDAQAQAAAERLSAQEQALAEGRVELQRASAERAAEQAQWGEEKRAQAEREQALAAAHQAEQQKAQDLLAQQETGWQARLHDLETDRDRRLNDQEDMWQQRSSAAQTEWGRRQTALESEAVKLGGDLRETREQLALERKGREQDRKAAQLAEWELRAEMVRIRRECGAAAGVLEKAQAALAAGSKPVEKKARAAAAAINWLDAGAGQKDDGRIASSEESTLLLRIECLQEEARVAKALFDRAEKELVHQEEVCAVLRAESAEREQQLNASIEQLKRDLEAANRIVQQTMHEVERRESDARSLRRKYAERAQQPTAPADTPKAGVPPAGFAASAIEPEILPPESRRTASEAQTASPPKPHRILAGLEKQAQAEVDAWRRGSDNGGGKPASKIKKWLRIKHS